jgi:hypothetical protein
MLVTERHTPGAHRSWSDAVLEISWRLVEQQAVFIDYARRYLARQDPVYAAPRALWVLLATGWQRVEAMKQAWET